MTDREMLELAAKAAGYELVLRASDPRCEHDVVGGFVHYRRTGDALVIWNPRDRNDDAFRLSVKTGEPFVVRTRCVTTMGGLIENFDPSIDGDDLRAARLIVTRAAAEIGKGKQ